MTTLTDRQRNMLVLAREHGDRYLLPRRFNGRSLDDETNKTYEAAQGLVESGYAHWLGFDSSLAPGIRLTGKPAP
jgi:hypothetical protein